MSDFSSANQSSSSVCGRIGVLMGGYSSERPISLKSGQAVQKALTEEGCDVVAIDIIQRDKAEIFRRLVQEDIDVAFIALHGELGEDGQIQHILEEAGIPYSGSGVEASRRALNKITALEIFNKEKIRTPEYIALSKNDKKEKIIQQVPFSPWVVKPSCEGSSLGITIVYDKTRLPSAIDEAFCFGKEAVIEQYIQGRELTVGILGDKTLPVIEIKTNQGFFNYTSKYEKGRTEYLVPAPLPLPVENEIKNLAFRAHRALGCSDFSRVDLILNEAGQGYVLEVNTIPGFTSTSLLPKAAGQAGLSFNQLCLNLVRMAYVKKEKNKDISAFC